MRVTSDESFGFVAAASVRELDGSARALVRNTDLLAVPGASCEAFGPASIRLLRLDGPRERKSTLPVSSTNAALTADIESFQGVPTHKENKMTQVRSLFLISIGAAFIAACNSVPSAPPVSSTNAALTADVESSGSSGGVAGGELIPVNDVVLTSDPW